MKETVKERRNSKRFRLRLAVVFSWRDEDGVLQSSDGYSSNISSHGIYVQTKCAPRPGNSVEMNVFLPQPAFDIRAVEIHAKGQVTRVNQGARGQVCGFAAMNRTVLIRAPLEDVLEKKQDSAPSSKVPQRVQDIGLHRS